MRALTPERILKEQKKTEPPLLQNMTALYKKKKMTQLIKIIFF